MSAINIDTTPQERVNILNKVYDFLRNNKIKNNLTIVDLLLDFCELNDLDIVEVGDAISHDSYLKEFIKLECKKINVIQEK